MMSNDKILKMKRNMPVIFDYLMVVILAFAINFISDGFLTIEHLHSIMKQVSFLGLVSIGQTFVILSGGIDLSLENTLLISNVISASIISGQNENTIKALLVVLSIGVLTGVFNGMGVYFLKIPAMIMTLATGTMLHGLAYIYCNGAPGGYSSDILSRFLNVRIMTMFSGVSMVWIILSIIAILILHYTTFGRSIYSIGSNRVAATYSGIGVLGTTVGIYVIASVLASLAGFFMLGYTGTSYMSTGAGYNMDSIASVVIGGVSIVGGSGSYVGTIAGVFIMILVNSLMTILHMDNAIKQVVQGILIIVLIILVNGRKVKR